MTERRVAVGAERGYEVVIGPGAAAGLAGLAEAANRVAIVVAAPLEALAERLLPDHQCVEILVVPDAEAGKTPETLLGLWRRLAQAGLTRDDLVVGLGGGAVTDLAGFAAATYLRGLAYAAVPTTVLAMADAAVGGKTGINLPEGKNLVGAFYEPKAVFCDLELLSGLPRREVASGMAEIAKCGLIADGAITELIAHDPAEAVATGSDRFADCLARAIAVKAAVVTADFRETGAGGIGREALNYGHTLAHAIERDQGFSWRHGEAVAVGMVFAAEVAHRLGLLKPAAVDLHRELLVALRLPVGYRGNWANLRSAMSLDKKTRGTTLRLVLLEGLRHPVIRAGIDEALLQDAFAALGLGEAA